MSSPKKKIKLDHTETVEDHFSVLPHNILVNIFKYLDFKSVYSCSTICAALNKASNENVLYEKVKFKYNMDKNLLMNYLTKLNNPKHFEVQYRFCYNDSDLQEEDEELFNEYVKEVLIKFNEHFVSIHFENCRNENILELIGNCTNLKDVTFFQCKGSFQFLTNLTNLSHIELVQCFISNQAVIDCLERNSSLKKLYLSSNSHVMASEVCESLAKYNINLENLHLAERTAVRPKGFRSLGRCFKLKSLEMSAGLHHSDPEDALEHIAAGCPRLEKLVLYGWKKITDDKLMPILHSCTQIKELDFRDVNITIKSCKEAALSLPLLKYLDVFKCNRIKNNEVIKLQQDFKDIIINSKKT
ncbi:F-box/LRR-repeat protein 20-like [Onthophagus taurus]|uniref:F-box/LRR-repeat protein 20-like n=1 Tax=Onthophagus taurus TaxID=166361 RepID=UPI0039BDB151